MALSPRSLRLYRQLRADGMPARTAHALARDEDIVEVVLIPAHDGYVVDTAELEAVTAGPHPNVATVDGSPVDGTIRFPEGVVVTLQLVDDQDSHVDDDECYSAEDITAWRENQWRFVGVVVTATLEEGEEEVGEESVWRVDVGDYWPGSEEGQAWHAARDMLAELARNVTAELESRADLAERRATAEREAAADRAALADGLKRLDEALHHYRDTPDHVMAAFRLANWPAAARFVAAAEETR